MIDSIWLKQEKKKPFLLAPRDLGKGDYLIKVTHTYSSVKLIVLLLSSASSSAVACSEIARSLPS